MMLQNQNWFVNPRALMGSVQAEMDRGFAAQVVLKRCEQLLREISNLKRGIREESFHDTRVASRRMRAALEAFQDMFPAEAWQAGFDAAKAITRTLGKAREEEVTLTLLKDLTNGGDLAENLCREYLEERCRKNVTRLQKKMMRQLRATDVRRMRSQFRSLVEELGPADLHPEPLDDIGASDEGAQMRPESTARRAHQALLFPPEDRPASRAVGVVEELAKPILSF